MIAVTCSPAGPKLDLNYSMPTPAPGEALLRVLLAGICSTDVEVAFRKYKGGFTGVLGHEFVGRIDALNLKRDKDCGFSIGDRVVSEINIVPSFSKSTNYHQRAQDPDRSVLGLINRDGVFAEYVCVPIENLHKVPDNIPPEVAVFTEPLAAACQILEQVHIKPTDRVAVLGVGKLGVLICFVLKACGKDVTAISKKGSHFDVLELRDIPTRKVSEAMMDMKEGFDVVVECTGNAEGFNSALELVKPYGKIVLKTTMAGMTHTNLTAVVVKELTLVGSRCGPFDAALRMLSTRHVVLDDIKKDIYDITAFPSAISRALMAETLKVILRVTPTSSN
uniref:Uncharacterized protein n=1 Tax=Rhodosorus marinus TaxID=101924 RepID=A0A7S0G599_9RHOD|mmetsp:Transcript_20550/g.29798  ORF Transcript_20550/g.29798 Transcript_20550/m.29798 type:complete len:335 (+) Transcript_20550:121-1125(+)